MPEIIGEYIDRLCTVEMRPSAGNLPRGVIHRLYASARSDGPPLTLTAATALLTTVKPADTVLLLTGAGGPPVLPRGEVDGLLGTAALARVLTFGCKANVIILTEDRVEHPLRAACAGAGLNFMSGDDPQMESAIRFLAMPLEHDACRDQAERLLDDGPTALVAIEKLAPNAVGVIHGSTGLNYDDVHGKPQYLVDGARQRGVLTVGIGDGGNEVGYGLIRDTVRAVMPAGAVCQCGCGDGTAAAVDTDVLVVAAISNWGAYGVAALMCWLMSTPEHLVSADDVDRMLRGVVAAGAFDGCHARPVLSDDGVPIDAQRGFLALLHAITDIGRSVLASPGH
jgi:hypothetical protein